MREPHPAFRALRLSGSSVVYAHEEKSSGVKIIRESYGPRFGPDLDKAAWMARQADQKERAKYIMTYIIRGMPSGH